MKRFWLTKVILALFFLISGLAWFAAPAYADHDFMSQSYWSVDEPRVTVFGDFYLGGNESVKINPLETINLVHTEGLRVQLQPIEPLPRLNLHIQVEMDTHWDKPDRLKTGVGFTHDLGSFIRGGERMRLEFTYLWNANIGSSSNPAHGETMLSIGASYLVLDGAKGRFDLPVSCRYYIRSDQPLLRLASSNEALISPADAALKGECGARMRMKIFSWLDLWAENWVGVNRDISLARDIIEGGFKFPIGNTVEFTLGARFAVPLDNSKLESTETIFAGWTLKF